MILTGSEIERERAEGRLVIEPFVPEQVNPNSYNFRLGRRLRIYRDGVLDARKHNAFDEDEIPDEGYVLEPGRLYLAHTIEVLGSHHYAPTFAARSSVARLGIFINLSANLGDIGYCGQWTLQLYTLNRVRVYPGINIGQMMWWRPQGEVELYTGKYQGAAGPRSSDIYVDFEKQVARQRLPQLRASVEVSEVGPKFAALAAVAHDVAVPTAFCVPAGEFADALDEATVSSLATAFGDLSATIGAFFGEDVARVQQATAGITVPEDLGRLLSLRMRELFGDAPEQRFAVRSSGLAEDSDGGSLAGIHDTVLGVEADAVVAAVKRCWLSYYSIPAVAARLRAGDTDWRPRLAVFVQVQVTPIIAGVAFAGQSGDEVVIEYVEGLADRLVAGVAVPVRVTSAQLFTDADDMPHAASLREVEALARLMHDHRKVPVDIEWAVDEDGVHLLQVRPQTSAELPTESDQPSFEAHSLYLDDLPADLPLGHVAGVYGSYVGKRGPAYRLAVEHDVAVGRGWVCRLNGRALRHPETTTALRALIAGSSASECVLDLGGHARQIIVPQAELVERLAELVGGPASRSLHTLIMREFLRGELGMISKVAGDGLMIEYTADGLMALNRGTAGAQHLVVIDRRQPSDAPDNVTVAPGSGLLLDHLDTIAQFTEVMHKRYGSVTLEWVLVDGCPHFVDYSALGQDTITVDASGTVAISPGTARGHLLRLDDDELLTRLSVGPAVSIDKAVAVEEHEGLRTLLDRVQAHPEPPVVHVSRPYAVLSVLIGSVAGFVFDEGSTLSHLAILLREAGVPAVAAADVPAEGEVLLSDGTMTVVGGPAVTQ